MRTIFPFLLMAFIVACSDNGKTKDPKVKFDQLEKVFGTGNWKLASYQDTSYLFFSREGNTDYKIYRYYMVDGDSVNTAIFKIQMQGDTIVMAVIDDLRQLVSVTDNGSSWQDDENLYRFKKIDSSRILLETNGISFDTLQLTLPISTFLVRSKDDFKTGTKNAAALIDSVKRRQ
ncbi:MAG TPA: hypothetical protein VFZ47_11355 [Chitinophagaceae bacterium]